MLVIGIENDQNIGVGLFSFSENSLDSRSVTLVFIMLDDPGAGQLSYFSGGIGAAVIDHNYLVNVLTRLQYQRADILLLLEGRHAGYDLRHCLIITLAGSGK